MSHKTLGALAIAVAGAVSLFAERTVAAGLFDYWGPVHNLRTVFGQQVVPLHLARLCDGRTLVMGFTRGGPTRAYESYTTTIAPQTLTQLLAAPLTPVTRTLLKMPVPLDKPYDPRNPALFDLNLCGGAAFTETGSLKVGGMTRVAYTTSGKVILGLPYSIELDPSGSAWQRLPNEYVGYGEGAVNWRWYPTLNRIASPLLRATSTLIVGGSTLVDGLHILAPPENPAKTYWANDSIEVDDDSGTNTLVVAHEHSNPDIRNATGYPHVIRQPDGRQLIHGAPGRPIMLSVDAGTLTPTLTRRPGPDVEDPSDGSSTSPLSMYWNDSGPYGNGSFVTCGGKLQTPYESSLDVFDVRTNTWRHFELGVKRSWCTTKLLPDGRVAIMGGVASDGSSGQGRTQIFDPLTNTVQTGTSEMLIKRAYHSTSILENDGSVFMCAGIPIPLYANSEITESKESATCQTYWPDYIWKPRPVLIEAPETVALGSTIKVLWYAGGNRQPIVDARLLPLPTDTHGFDSGQANVQLKVLGSVPVAWRPGYFTVTLQLPQAASATQADTAHLLPPGCYSLFLIDAQRVPSTGFKTRVVW